jgi:hypothetical protein
MKTIICTVYIPWSRILLTYALTLEVTELVSTAKLNCL